MPKVLWRADCQIWHKLKII